MFTHSYAPDEDDLVVDPFLAQHLAHWGIDIMQVCNGSRRCKYALALGGVT